MQLRHSIRPAQVHVIEVLGRLLRYELLHRYDELLALEALREQVVHGHEYLTMLSRPLHLLGRDLLVHGHLATLFILQLRKQIGTLLHLSHNSSRFCGISYPIIIAISGLQLWTNLPFLLELSELLSVLVSDDSSHNDACSI